MLVSALCAAPGIIDAGKKAWTGYKVAKAAVNVAKKFRHAPDEMGFMLSLCDCLLEAMPVVESLATRHLSLRIVGSSVLLARQAIQQCDALVNSTVDDTEDGWAEWMRTGRKFELLKEVCAPRLAAAHCCNL